MEGGPRSLPFVSGCGPPPAAHAPRPVVFLLRRPRAPAAGGAAGVGSGGVRWDRDAATGSTLAVFEREEDLLLSWAAFVRGADPDIITLFQARTLSHLVSVYL